MKILQLALTHERRRVGTASALDDASHGVGSGGVGERGKLVQVLFDDSRPDPDQDRSFPDRRTPGRGQR
jgi:hypothetical protein